MPLILSPVSDDAEDPADLVIGLLNNLSDAGLKSGEQQFIDLVAGAAGARRVRMRFFTLPQIERGPRARQRLDGLYGDVDDLMEARLDGLIVTGCEPRAATLRDEPFWSALAGVVDWARDSTRSTIWSCLAAHAAVLHLDGIERRRLPVKCSGIFPVERVGSHPLLADSPEGACVPHSRYNGLDEDDLRRHGYEILTRSPVVGVDTFAKRYRSLFVFLQGHPEYDRDALRREYRRDVARYRDGVSTHYPSPPMNYFSRETESALRASVSLPPASEAVLAWEHGFATSLFKNWLDTLSVEAPAYAL